MPKVLLLALTLLIIVVVSAIVITTDSGPPKSEMDTAINQAKYIYSLRKSQGVDFSAGPCLSDALMPDWVLDIAHSPRTAADDLPANQCPAYREGRAHHFVELDPDGNLIRAR